MNQQQWERIGDLIYMTGVDHRPLHQWGRTQKYVWVVGVVVAATFYFYRNGYEIENFLWVSHGISQEMNSSGCRLINY